MREVDDEHVQAHRDEPLDRHGAAQDDVPPVEAVQALRQDLNEAGVAVIHADAQRSRDGDGAAVISLQV